MKSVTLILNVLVDDGATFKDAAAAGMLLLRKTLHHGSKPLRSLTGAETSLNEVTVSPSDEFTLNIGIEVEGEET
jgi:hypothetical protein